MLVIGGGQNAEHEVSLASAAAVAAALRMIGRHEVRTVTIDRGRGLARRPASRRAPPPPNRWRSRLPLLAEADVIFPAVHGALGEDGALAALCALAGVAGRRIRPAGGRDRHGQVGDEARGGCRRAAHRARDG